MLRCTCFNFMYEHVYLHRCVCTYTTHQFSSSIHWNKATKQRHLRNEPTSRADPGFSRHSSGKGSSGKPLTPGLGGRAQAAPALPRQTGKQAWAKPMMGAWHEDQEPACRGSQQSDLGQFKHIVKSLKPTENVNSPVYYWQHTDKPMGQEGALSAVCGGPWETVTGPQHEKATVPQSSREGWHHVRIGPTVGTEYPYCLTVSP